MAPRERGLLVFVCRSCGVAVAVNAYEVIEVSTELQDARARIAAAICSNCHSLVDLTGLTENLVEKEGSVTKAR